MGNLEVCCKSDKGQKRATNEDSVLTAKLGEVYLLAIADGLGGHAAGEVASKVVTIEIEQYLKTNLTEQNVTDAMRGAISKANKELCLLSQENPAYKGMGSTLVAAIVSEGRALIANIGDSRAYLINDGIEMVTKDHSLVQELVDKGIITKEDAHNHPQKNIVTRTLGLENEVTPDFYEVSIAGKVLLLCSDGLTDALEDEVIRETTLGTKDLDEACANLINLANEKGASDNISVILAKAK